MPRKGYGEFAKKLSGTPPYATAPQEENLPEMGGNLGPCPVPQPCYQSLPAQRMNVAFVPSTAYQGFQTTTSSQGGQPPRLLVMETAMTKLPEVLTLNEKQSAGH